MDGIGWEIQPVGWLLLAILGIFVIHFIIRWLQHSSNKNSGNI
jgi:hypothetical protein